MIHDQIEFLNVAELRDGVLYRFPLDSARFLRHRTALCYGCERSDVLL